MAKEESRPNKFKKPMPGITSVDDFLLSCDSLTKQLSVKKGMGVYELRHLYEPLESIMLKWLAR